MSSRTFHSIMVSLLIFSTGKYVEGQPSLHITSSNINTEVINTTYSFTAGDCLLNVAPYIKINAGGQFSPVINPVIPLSKIQVNPISIGPGVNLIGGAVEKPLSTTPTTIYQVLLGLLNTSGAVNIQYRITQADMLSFAWKAGIYSVPLTFTTPGGLLCLGSQTFPASFTLTVDPFITLPPIPNITLNVNSFDYFRTTPLNNSIVVSTTETVPLAYRLKSLNNTFQYTNGYAGANDPVASVNNIVAQITTPATFNNINLSTTDQLLTTSAGQPVAVGNKQTNSINFSISPQSLKQNFFQKGNYTTTLNLTAKDGSNQTLTNAVRTPSLAITVSDMGELIVNNPVVNLSFENLNDYQSGKSVNMPNHLTISKTSAYDVYVSSSSNNLTSGSKTIPVNYIQIGPGSGQSGVNTIRLSPTAQKLITSAAPCLDRSINIRYEIDQTDVSKLLEKSVGTYSTTVTYSFIAP